MASWRCVNKQDNEPNYGRSKKVRNKRYDSFVLRIIISFLFFYFFIFFENYANIIIGKLNYTSNLYTGLNFVKFLVLCDLADFA